MDERIKDILIKKMESLIRCLERVEQKRGNSFQDLSESLDHQDIVILNLERSVQLSIDIGSILLSAFKIPIPETMSEVFQSLSENQLLPEDIALSLRKSVGFRNIAVHEYSELNWEIVFQIATTRLKDFKDFIKVVNDLILST